MTYCYSNSIGRAVARERSAVATLFCAVAKAEIYSNSRQCCSINRYSKQYLRMRCSASNSRVLYIKSVQNCSNSSPILDLQLCPATCLGPTTTSTCLTVTWYPASSTRPTRLTKQARSVHADKKEIKFSSHICKETQRGAVAKSYMRKGFLIYEEMRKSLYMRRPLVTDDCNCSIQNFLIYEEN